MKEPSPIYKNIDRIRKNIKVLRCYLQLSKTEFADKTGIGVRATEFENGRFRPSMDELKKIAELAEIKIEWIIHNNLFTTLSVV
jgi:DNA-binding XRE family transcriptional regulator